MALEEILVSEDNEVTNLHGYPRNSAVAAKLRGKVAPIELGEALLEQQALLDVVAVMLLEMAFLEAVAVIILRWWGGACFFCCHEEIMKRSIVAWLVGIESDIFGAESIYGVGKGWMAQETCISEFAFHRCSNFRMPIYRCFISGTPF